MMAQPTQVHLIAATRPNFMKVAPLHHELLRRSWCSPVLVHTGQHYDLEMSDFFFTDLGLPKPNHSLGIGGGSHGEQLGRLVVAYEEILQKTKPGLVIVVGDVNATAACTFAAKKLNLPVAHVEAGLRSRDRTMPEEINRVVTDAICDLHFTPSRDADENLQAEGVPASCIKFVGNIMIDSLLKLEPAVRRRMHPFPDFAGRPYAVATFHRPSNVDDPNALKRLAEALVALGRRVPVIFPLHPRSRQRLAAAGLLDGLERAGGMALSAPLGYADFLRCVFDASMVVTDSGGIQEETTFLGIPCFTARTTTERPITVTQGTNRLIKLEDIEGLPLPNARQGEARAPEFWDGKTASRIADALERYFADGAPLRKG